jgi:hypothetical protein
MDAEPTTTSARGKRALLETTASQSTAAETETERQVDVAVPARTKPRLPQTPPPSTNSVPQRHGDRGSPDDAGAKLPTFVRYRDLQAAGIVGNWVQLRVLIDEHGFPPGVLLSPNVRAWDASEVKAWLDARPVQRKLMPPTARRPRRNRKEIADQKTL